ncbi:inner membrane protein translocase component YidC [Corynebacterium humireducens NBRC 106098 = DSM 45392]|uniref:Membrane protein insertase YidC n=1 Tax=Corynebacterium humireducens NBRC 106098 = DSM 45392 TaxID=1223515 RepID=A0A0B5DBI0_9CORY|nr:inner membrane protein translocase component YidC [Corynebacterium humireducens NBRC 106098 = DSM 45392]
MSPTVLEPFIYPVSGVLKLWHILLHSVLGINDSTAWIISLFGLVLTVRLFLVPFFWAQAKTARISTAMRPEQMALKDEYATRTDRESVAEQMRREKELKERYGHKVSAGCVPALIQLPVFLGLYQVLIRIARPTDELAVAADTRVGFLNAEEIKAFLRATVNDVPLPAYISMPEETLARLGTTAGDVRSFVLPYLLAAVVFTSVNMAVSIWRNQQTLDWESGMARGMHRVIIILAVLVPFLLFWIAFTGPLPVAIVLYWFANNLWTMVQTLIMYPILHRQIPLDESFHELHRQGREKARAAAREARQVKWDARRRKAVGAVQPWRIPEISRELKAEKAERRERLAAEKAERKALEKERQQARSALQREETNARVERWRAKLEARKNARSSSPPEEPTASDGPDHGPSAAE